MARHDQGCSMSAATAPEGPPRSGPGVASMEGATSAPDLRGGLATLMAAQDDKLSNCVHCGFCLPACPTYTRLGDEADSPRGRLHLMRAVGEGRLDPASEAFQVHLDRCLGCRACETVCPSGVEYGFLLERAREVAVQARPAGWPVRMLLGMIASPFLLRVWMAASRLLRWSRVPAVLGGSLPAWRSLRQIRTALGMLDASRSWRPGATVRSMDGTSGSSGTAVSVVDPGGEDGGARPAGGRSPRTGGTERVGLLTGCVQAHLFARVNDATRRVLIANGFEVVEVPDQGCCGALHAHAGRLDEARGMARRNMRSFRGGKVDWIAANAAGCGAAMKDYGHLLDHGAPARSPGSIRADEDGVNEGLRPEAVDDGDWFTSRVRDVSELLCSEDHGPRTGARLSLRVAYDPPCHLLHAQRVGSPPLQLLRSIPGVEVISVPNGEECCGGAGIYGLTHPDLGGRIGHDKVASVLSTEAHLLVTGNPGCAMQIGAGLRMAGSTLRVAHPVEVLDESYRRAGFYDADPQGADRPITSHEGGSG